MSFGLKPTYKGIKGPLTILKLEDIKGENRLEVLKKYGAQALITDMDILTSFYRPNAYNYHSKNGTSKGKYGNYITSTFKVTNWFGPFSYYDMNYIDKHGENINVNMSDNFELGTRPVINCPDELHSKIKIDDGIEMVEFGEFPQDAVSKNEQLELEKAFALNCMAKTDRVFHLPSIKNERKIIIDAVSIPTAGDHCSSYHYITHNKISAGSLWYKTSSSDDTWISFVPYTEYNYNGSNYIRYQYCSSKSATLTLSNGEEYKNGDYIWIKVSPVNWLVDSNRNLLISEKILVSGIPIYAYGKIRSNYLLNLAFEDTLINEYLYQYMYEEMIDNSLKKEKGREYVKEYK